MKNDKPRRTGGGERRRASIVPAPRRETAPNEIVGYQPITQVTFTGATAPNGNPWVKAMTSCSRLAWIPYADFAGDASAAKDTLIARNIHLHGEKMAEAIRDGRAVTVFEPMPLIEAPGWSGPNFTLPSGTIIIAPGMSSDSSVLFDYQDYKCATAGEGKAWFRGVKRYAAGQPIVTFALMIGFTAPLLRLSPIIENIGFELSGPKGRGKTTLLYLASSIAGPALNPQGQNYWISANTTMNALEAQMPLHSDMLMPIEEMTSMNAGESEKKRAEKGKELIFRMAAGTGKDRLHIERQSNARFVWLSSTNDPTSKLMAVIGGEAVDAAADRLLALPVPKGPRGVFTRPLPDGFETGGQAAQAIHELVGANYGHAILRFLKRLVEDRAADEAKLKDEIVRLMAEFRSAVDVGTTVGSEARVADAFGMVYAAGILAQRYGPLPANLDCLEAARYCYRLNRDSVRPDLANISRVIQLAADKRTLTIDTTNEGKKYRKRLAAAPALIKVRRDGSRELVLTPKMLSAAFGKRKAFLADPEIRKVLRHDGDRTSAKLQLVHGGKMERVVCLALSAKRR